MLCSGCDCNHGVMQHSLPSASQSMHCDASQTDLQRPLGQHLVQNSLQGCCICPGRGSHRLLPVGTHMLPQGLCQQLLQAQLQSSRALLAALAVSASRSGKEDGGWREYHTADGNMSCVHGGVHCYAAGAVPAGAAGADHLWQLQLTGTERNPCMYSRAGCSALETGCGAAPGHHVAV